MRYRVAAPVTYVFTPQMGVVFDTFLQSLQKAKTCRAILKLPDFDTK
jgi:hypothetical protein